MQAMYVAFLLDLYNCCPLPGQAYKRGSDPAVTLWIASSAELGSALAGWFPNWVGSWTLAQTQDASTWLDPDTWLKSRHLNDFLEREYAKLREILDAYVVEHRLYREDRKWLDEMLRHFQPEGTTIRLSETTPPSMGWNPPPSTTPRSGKTLRTPEASALSNVPLLLTFAEPWLKAMSDETRPKSRGPGAEQDSDRDLERSVRLRARADGEDFLLWPPPNPINRARELAGASLAPRHTKGDSMRGSRPLPRAIAEDLARKLDTEKARVELEYDLWRANFNWYREPLPSAIGISPRWAANYPQGYAYGFPETCALCYWIYAGIHELWRTTPDVRSCRQCGKLFLPTPRGHDQVSCSPGCRRKHYYHRHFVRDRAVTQ